MFSMLQSHETPIILKSFSNYYLSLDAKTGELVIISTLNFLLARMAAIPTIIKDFPYPVQTWRMFDFLLFKTEFKAIQMATF
jgi:hypothetical protein